jgi:hypothetical protein
METLRIAIIMKKAAPLYLFQRYFAAGYWYMHEVRALSAAGGGQPASTHLWTGGSSFWRKKLRGAGWVKIFAAAMIRHTRVGGEQSGGLSVRGWIRGKDGIFASAPDCKMLRAPECASHSPERCG